MKYANCGASVKSNGKVKKMNTGGFMKIGDGLQKLDVNKTDEKVKANKGKAVKKRAKFSSGGMAEDKRKDKEEESEKKGGKKSKRGELVEASYGKSVRKNKKK